jgi:hypothetical protein
MNTAVCTPDWVCSAYTACTPTGEKSRICTDHNTCGNTVNKPEEQISCIYTPTTTQANDSTIINTTGGRNENNETLITNTTELPISEPVSHVPWLFVAVATITLIGLAGFMLYEHSKGKKSETGFSNVNLHADAGKSRQINADSSSEVVSRMSSSPSSAEHASGVSTKIVQTAQVRTTMQSSRFAGQQTAPNTKQASQVTQQQFVLQNYIRQCIEKKMPKEQIRALLLSQGWRHEIVDSELNKY